MKFRYLIILLCSVFALPAWSWNFRVHATVAELAYGHLSTKKQAQLDSDAKALLAVLDKVWLNEVNRFDTASPFARTAILFDEWRMLKLGTVFQKYGVPVPKALQPIADSRIRQLHFVDLPWPDTGQCGDLGEQERDRIHNWFTRLQAARKEVKTPVGRGIVNAMLAHVVADFHQPLHSVFNIAKGCDSASEGGGINYCLTSPHQDGKGHRRCGHTLHELWDSGGGYIKSNSPHSKTQEHVKKLLAAHPHKFLNGCDVHEVGHWLDENHELAEFIFSTPEYQQPHEEYLDKTSHAASHRMAMAACRLTRILH
ncbi:S1/P1 nuclease [Parendozoicomonas haliclonae]|uniref:S1/P1 Nuclease n=1 Tax=Parendozoicomonas haliclonae TaxID=1960125 RepID=A0A1X7ADV7_9GAMM|nr:S1/P1 nuclease [Parendozoicomonas haliclonae]SMA32783.1 S1/P1 Nuclease [Parendozoicomonas haliclonae]